MGLQTVENPVADHNVHFNGVIRVTPIEHFSMILQKGDGPTVGDFQSHRGLPRPTGDTLTNRFDECRHSLARFGGNTP